MKTLEGCNCIKVYQSVCVFWQFEPGDTLKYTPGFFQLTSKMRPIFDHFDQKPSVFGTIIKNLTENGAY